MSAGRIPTHGVDHVGFNVPDLEAALCFFTDAFGCELVNRNGPVDYGNGVIRECGDGPVRQRPTVRTPGMAGTGRQSDHGGVHRPGRGHLCFAVADLDASLAAVQTLLGVVPESPRQIPDGRRFSRFVTPWGLTIQLLTLIRDGHDPRPGERPE